MSPAEYINYDLQTVLNKTMELLSLSRENAKLYMIGLIVQDKCFDMAESLHSFEQKHEQALVDKEIFGSVNLSRESIDSIYAEVKMRANNGSYSTKDMAEVVSIKLNSLSAGIQERFSEKDVNDNLDIAGLGKRLKQDILNFGNKSKSETKALEYLKDHTKQEFELNKNLFFRDSTQWELNGTPDAIYKEDGVIIAVAEFKEYGGFNLPGASSDEKRAINALKSQGRKQLLLYMKICQAEVGYLVLTCQTDGLKEIERIDFDTQKFDKMISNKIHNHTKFRSAHLADPTFLQNIEGELRKYKKF